MKKKMLLAIIAAVVIFIAFGLYSADKLRHIEIVKTVNINASATDAYEAISNLNRYPEWSPFLAQDPAQKYEVKGVASTVGSRFYWNGNNGKDVRFQEITKLVPGTLVGMKCEIEKRFKAQPVFEYRITKKGNGIGVIQTFNLESGLIDAFFLWLFGVKKEMTTTNRLGLDLLKKNLESK